MDLMLIAAVVVLLWLISLGFYIFFSRRQRDIQSEIESLQKMLDRPESDD